MDRGLISSKLYWGIARALASVSLALSWMAIQPPQPVAAASNLTFFKHDQKPWLTLVTCTNYDETTKTYLSRVVVRAELVQVNADLSSPGR